MKCSLLITIFLFVSLTLTASAMAAEPIFYAPFDGDPIAEVSLGNGKADVKGNPKYVEGKVGQGALLAGSATFGYETNKNVNPEVGTIMFWVKLSKDNKLLTGQQEFFSMFVSDGNRIRLHLNQNNFGIHWFHRIDGLSGIARKENVVWKEGEWHHVTATWAGDKPLILYLDDEKIIGDNSGVLDPLPISFYVGSYKGSAPFLEAIMDEFYIFDEYDVTKEPGEESVEPGEKLATCWGKIKD